MPGQVLPMSTPPQVKSLSFGVELLEEPRLQFADTGWALDPKAGLQEYGPRGRSLDLHPSRINIGFVGTGATVEEAKRWLDRCSQPIPATGDKLRQAPPFPGLSESGPFATSFGFHPSWEAQIAEREISRVLEEKDHRSLFEKMLELLAAKVQQIAERDLRPHVIVCALPRAVTKYCWSLGGQVSFKPKLTRIQRALLRRIKQDRESGQMLLFPEAFELSEDSGGNLAYRDFRRALKARVMKWHCPIQIVQERTFRDGPDVQDAATRAWNFCTALYYKAGGLGSVPVAVEN